MNLSSTKARTQAQMTTLDSERILKFLSEYPYSSTPHTNKILCFILCFAKNMKPARILNSYFLFEYILCLGTPFPLPVPNKKNSVYGIKFLHSLYLL
jgi:hypothetical protein